MNVASRRGESLRDEASMEGSVIMSRYAVAPRISGLGKNPRANHFHESQVLIS